MIGRILEVVSGQPLEQFLREQFLAPIGTQGTFLEVDATLRRRVPVFVLTGARRETRGDEWTVGQSTDRNHGVYARGGVGREYGTWVRPLGESPRRARLNRQSQMPLSLGAYAPSLTRPFGCAGVAAQCVGMPHSAHPAAKTSINPAISIA